MFLPYLVGMLAAASNATSNVLQRGAHVDALAESNGQFSFKFLVGVMHRPRWLLGVLTMLTSFLLQMIGLGLASLSVIQPLIILELPFALIAAAIFLRERLSRNEWLGAVLMLGGVVLFVTMLSPQPGNVQGTLNTGLGAAMLVGTVGAAALAFFYGMRSGPRLKTALLGISSGIGFGMTAVLTKDMVVKIHDHGLLSIFSSWQLYIVIIFGLTSLYLFQYALASGRLMYAQPGVTLADPFVAVIWGVTLYNENVSGGVFLALAMIGVVMAATGVFLIARGGLSRDEPAKRRSR